MSTSTSPTTLEAVAEMLRLAAEALLRFQALEREKVAVEADPMLSAVEAGDELGCSSAHIRSQCASGAIKALRTDGGHYRIRTSALRAYERRRTGGPR